MTVSHQIDKIVREFARDSGRSLSIKSLSGPEIEITVRGDESRPGASTLKVAISMEIARQLDNGLLSSSLLIKRKDLGTSIYPTLLEVLREDHTFTIKELCGIMLATSDNLISQYLLDLAGIQSVNSFLKDISCRQSMIRVGYRDFELSPIGRANTTSTMDQIRLLTHLDQENTYSWIRNAMVNGLRKSRIALRFPEDISIANKTGSLNGVANDVALISDREIKIAIAVLTDRQTDAGRTGIEIADTVYAVWQTIGGRVHELREEGTPSPDPHD
ncbi:MULTISPECIES: serine hydrolase [unclassified Streptosporangium]|uniref:serine hydrolase n=1 Tax=unclassified Streptosporangium TaxID=2632669 RepID=UPI002E2B8701|nr:MULTISPECIES: serine hydrolase [unclassified Streptosporangium]